MTYKIGDWVVFISEYYIEPRHGKIVSIYHETFYYPEKFGIDCLDGFGAEYVLPTDVVRKLTNEETLLKMLES